MDLISGATHQVYSNKTVAGGSFSFTNGNTGGALVPGDWGLWVPPQANLSLVGCKPCGILPQANAPAYAYYTAQTLSSTSALQTVHNVSTLPYSATLFGNVTQGGTPVSGGAAQLIAPAYNGFVLSNNTTANAGNYTLKVPFGTWVLKTTQPGVPDHFDYQQVTVAAARVWVNSSISNYLTYGTVYQTASPTSEVPYGGNVTLYDIANGYAWTTPTLNGGFYSVGTYPSGFSGGGSNSFDVVLQTIGYQTVWYPLTVSGASQSGGALPHNVWTASQYDPAVFSTTLNYSTNFKWLNTSTAATLGNDSTIPELANSSVGDLWAQLALDWQHNLSFNSANLGTVQNWLNSSGPFFPAGADMAKVNNSGYNESQGGSFAFHSACTTGFCDLTTAGGISYSWAKSYSLNGSAPTNASSYTASFNFRHPTNYQAINYTVNLPSGYALQASTSAPAGSRLVAAGPGGTWTKFVLVSQPWSSPSGTASFTFVKYGKVTANVNATTTEFTFSKQNVLNGTHGNYSVIVGTNQNVSFSAAGSTFPAGINGSRYLWVWGDGTNSSTTNAVSYHTYGTAAEYTGTLFLTSSGGTTANVTFHVYVGSGGVSGTIVSNASAAEKRTGGNNVPYLMVNSSTTLMFNATGFASTLYAGGPAGKLSVAAWNATAGPTNHTSNFTASSNVYVPGNFTVTFTGDGDNEYLSSATIGGQPVSFLGWQYNVTVKVWDAVGGYATQTLIVLVHDSQKPVSVATVQNAAGTNVTSSGVVEGANHTVEVKLVSSYSSDPNGGSLTWYNWSVTNSGNGSANRSMSLPARSGLRAPLPWILWLEPQTKPYTVNLTVTDRAGNTAYNTASLTVAVNTSTRPVLAVGNLTAPTTMTDQSSYTAWINVTNTLGANSTALGVQVAFYLLPPSGSGTPIYVGGSPGSVTFYGYDNTTGEVNRTLGTGSINIAYNETVRASVTFSPARTGTWELWANATAVNEFAGDYATGGNQAHVTVTLNANPIVEYEEVGIGIAVIAVIILLIILVSTGRLNMPRRGGGSSSKSSSGGRSGLDRSGKKDSKSDAKSTADDDEDDE